MAVASEHVFGVIAGAICGSLILFRCGYRLFSRCRTHPHCHRTWHADDAYMAFAIVPLIARTTIIYYSFDLNPSQTFGLPTESDAAAQGISTAQLEDNYVMSHMLLLAARVSYLTYLWCLKLCLLNFYCRFIRVYPLWKAAAAALWWSLVVTYFAILILIFTECRPINLYWDPDPDKKYSCHRALANLLTMGILNIVTDIALILLPFPILRHSRLPGRQKVQLGILFGIGIIVVLITIIRLPLVVNQSLSIQARTTVYSLTILMSIGNILTVSSREQPSRSWALPLSPTPPFILLSLKISKEGIAIVYQAKGTLAFGRSTQKLTSLLCLARLIRVMAQRPATPKSFP